MPNLSYYLKEATKRSLSFLLSKLQHQAISKVLHISEGKLFKPYDPEKFDVSPSDKFKFFFNKEELENIIHLFIGEKYTSYRSELVKTCNAYVAREIQFLGRPPFHIKLTKDFWQSDPTTGFKWQFKYFTNYPYDEILSLDKDADVKFPWELARLQMLPQLAVAFLLTNERKFLLKLVEIASHWIDHNPVGFGLGWRSTMETSLRAISLVWVRKLLPTQLSEFGLDELIDKSLISHGKFIDRNTEYSDINGNHHSSCLIGLLYIGLYFGRKHDLAGSWTKQAQNGLEKEVLLESYPDGLCIEGSLPYHRLITEFFLHGHILLKLNDRQPSEAYTLRLRAMLEAVSHYSKPNGDAPVLGDHDDAQILKLGTTNLNDHRYLSECLGLITGNSADGVNDSNKDPITIWLSGNRYANTKSESKRPLASQSHFFPATGLGILRRNHSYILMDGGDTGLLGRGSHGHNDLLSIEVTINSRDILRDPGNGSYTRSTHNRANDLLASRHNLPVIDDIEYAEFRSIGFPVAKNPPHYEFLTFNASEAGPQSMAATISYYAKKKSISQSRTVSLNANGSEVTITDSFEHVGHLLGLPVSWRFLLDPKLSVRLVSYGFEITNQDEAFFIMTSNNNNLSYQISDGIIFQSYGRQEQTQELHIKGIIESVNPSFEIKVYALAKSDD